MAPFFRNLLEIATALTLVAMTRKNEFCRTLLGEIVRFERKLIFSREMDEYLLKSSDDK